MNHTSATLRMSDDLALTEYCMQALSAIMASVRHPPSNPVKRKSPPIGGQPSLATLIALRLQNEPELTPWIPWTHTFPRHKGKKTNMRAFPSAPLNTILCEDVLRGAKVGRHDGHAWLHRRKSRCTWRRFIDEPFFAFVLKPAFVLINSQLKALNSTKNVLFSSAV